MGLEGMVKVRHDFHTISVIKEPLGMLCPSCKTLLEEAKDEIGPYKRLKFCRGCNVYYPYEGWKDR